MTTLCTLCHISPALPHRTICADCRRLRRRLVVAKDRRSKARPMTWQEYERMQEAEEGKVSG